MRDDFPIFQKNPDWIYLDTAATAQKPKSVIDALTKFYSEEYATVHRAVYKQAALASEKYHQTRVATAQFLNAELDEIVFTRGTTDAINLVASSFGKKILKHGDEILISEMEHHSNFVPWQMLAKEVGATLRFIPVDEKGVLEWQGKITKQTKIVSLAHMSNVTGTINPIDEIARAAHAVGAVLVVDGAQAAPHMKIDVKALNCDFYAFSSHKCYGPTGLGVLFGKKEWLSLMDPIQGGGDMIASVTLEETTYQEAPIRFESGTPNIGAVIAFKNALEFIEKISHVRLNSLLEYATNQFQLMPNLKIIGTAPRKGPIITFKMDAMHPLDIATFLDLQNISIRSGHLCAQPLLRRFGCESAARVSFGIYNTKEDVDAFIRAMVRLNT